MTVSRRSMWEKKTYKYDKRHNVMNQKLSRKKYFSFVFQCLYFSFSNKYATLGLSSPYSEAEVLIVCRGRVDLPKIKKSQSHYDFFFNL